MNCQNAEISDPAARPPRARRGNSPESPCNHWAACDFNDLQAVSVLRERRAKFRLRRSTVLGRSQMILSQLNEHASFVLQLFELLASVSRPPLRRAAHRIHLLRRARRDRLPVVAHYVLTVVAAVLVLRGDCEAASTILAAAGTEIELSFRTPGHYALYRHY